MENIENWKLKKKLTGVEDFNNKIDILHYDFTELSFKLIEIGELIDEINHLVANMPIEDEEEEGLWII